MSSPRPAPFPGWLPWLLMLGTLAVYGQVVRCEFLQYDDPDYVTANAIVQQGLTWAGVQWAFTTGHASNWHPVTWLSHQLDCQLFGTNPAWHHLMNLAIHLVNVLLLFRWLVRWTGAGWRSALVAALFALHPLHVESVAWVSERKDVLSGFFFLLVLHAHARYAEKPGAARYALVGLWLALGLMAKPMLVTVPCVLLLLDLWPLQRLRLAGVSDGAPEVLPPRPWPALLLEKAPWFALVLVFSVVTVLVQHASRSVVSVEHLSLAARCSNALIAWALYVLKTVWPSGLAVFYPHPGELAWWSVALAGVFLAAVTAGAVGLRRRWPALLVGWLWFIGMLVPVIGIVQVGMQRMADRYTYLPHVGLFIAMVWGAAALAERLRVPGSVRFATGVGLAGVCAVLTTLQVRHWRSTRTLFQHAHAVTARNHVACAVLGNIYWRDGDPAAGRAFFERALEFRPDYAEGHFAFANSLLTSGQLDDAETRYRRALELNSRMGDALSGLGLVLTQQGRAAEGVAFLDRALLENPNHTQARFGRALAWQSLGRQAEAAAEFSALLREIPNLSDALLALGNSFLTRGRHSEAIQCFEQIVRLQPDSVPALGRLAWLLATHADARVRNGPRAIELARRACDRTGDRDALSLNTLAAAYAETGQFDLAVATVQRALAAAQAGGQPHLEPILQKLLAMYQAKTAYRE